MLSHFVFTQRIRIEQVSPLLTDMRSVLTELTLGHPAFQFNTCAAPTKLSPLPRHAHSLTAKRGNLGSNTQSGTGENSVKQASPLLVDMRRLSSLSSPYDTLRFN